MKINVILTFLYTKTIEKLTIEILNDLICLYTSGTPQEIGDETD